MNEDARRGLVANLHHLGNRPHLLERIHQVKSVGIHGIGKGVGAVHLAPALGNNLLAGIGPVVAVVDIEQERHARSLDLLRVGDDVVLVGVGLGIVVATRSGIAVLRLRAYKSL